MLLTSSTSKTPKLHYRSLESTPRPMLMSSAKRSLKRFSTRISDKRADSKKSRRKIRKNKSMTNKSRLDFQKPRKKSHKIRDITNHSNKSPDSVLQSSSVLDKTNQTKTSEAYYKEHLKQTLLSLKKLKTIPRISVPEIFKKTVKLPSTNKKTLVVDLDETLIHCCTETEPCDIQIHINLPNGDSTTIGINIRPYALDLLRSVREFYEIIVFTASQQLYADAVLNYLDPRNELIDFRFYRQDCFYNHGFFIKDLRIFQNRLLKNIVIVDNSVYSFGSQLNNGIPIISWYDDKTDKELLNLIDYLNILYKADDVRVVNKKIFKLKKMYKHKTKETNS